MLSQFSGELWLVDEACNPLCAPFGIPVTTGRPSVAKLAAADDWKAIENCCKADVIETWIVARMCLSIEQPGFGLARWRELADWIEVEPLGAIHLPRGPVLFVEAGADYHAQHWPETLGVTLNVIPRDFETGDRIQYILDQDMRMKTILHSNEAD